VDMDISMDIHRKFVDMDTDMDGKFHIHKTTTSVFVSCLGLSSCISLQFTFFAAKNRKRNH